ncbi:MAG: hypothetical protein DRR06_18735 [Gammaproteobacteria bacterium]|nr:MAG: hypothetical protein DRR06_18735 [Gammaproteobacteria bacterium]
MRAVIDRAQVTVANGFTQRHVVQLPCRSSAPTRGQDIPRLRQHGFHRVIPVREVELAATEVDRKNALDRCLRSVFRIPRVTEIDAKQPRLPSARVVVAARHEIFGPNDITQRIEFHEQVVASAVGLP